MIGILIGFIREENELLYFEIEIMSAKAEIDNNKTTGEIRCFKK